MSTDPGQPTDTPRREADRRVRYLTAGAVGVTVVGLGIFAGLAVAGHDAGHDGAGREHGAHQQEWHHGGDHHDGFFDHGAHGGDVGPGGGTPSAGPSGEGGAAAQGSAPGDGYAGSGGAPPSQGSSGAS